MTDEVSFLFFLLLMLRRIFARFLLFFSYKNKIFLWIDIEKNISAANIGRWSNKILIELIDSLVIISGKEQ